jgi:hypothetical protein
VRRVTVITTKARPGIPCLRCPPGTMPHSAAFRSAWRAMNGQRYQAYTCLNSHLRNVCDLLGVNDD